MVLPNWASDECLEKASQDRQTLLLQRMSAGTSARDSPSRGKTHTPFFFLYSTALPLTACATDFSDDPTFSLEHCVKYPRK